MKSIKLLEEYGISDAGNQKQITQILDKIDIGGSNSIELDLTRCIIDYPATSMLIDSILFQLKSLKGRKNITIKISYFLPEQTLLNDLLGDSKFFKIEAKTEIPIIELTKQIQDCLIPENIVMKIDILDRKGDVKKEYEYGNQ